MKQLLICTKVSNKIQKILNADHAAFKFANFVIKLIMGKRALVKHKLFQWNGQKTILESTLKSALNVQHI